MHVPPRIGLGTFRCTGEAVQQAVQGAIDVGIRHIDTASIYKNEIEIGDAIRSCIRTGSISREDIYVTSKISPYEQGIDKAREACESICNRLDLGYVDLVLIHWPGVAKTPLESPENAQKRQETWRVMEEFHARGQFKALGVSNYELSHLKELLEYCHVKPVVNQVECHPKYPQIEMRAFCEEHGVRVVAYSCFGAGALFDEEKYPELYQVARETGKSPPQVLLCWGLEKNCCVLAKSVQKSRIEEYSPQNKHMQPLCDHAHYFTADHLDILDSLSVNRGIEKFCWDPSNVL